VAYLAKDGTVGVLDFQSRFPGALVASGVAEEDGS
jgi:hypothetical protein